MENLNENAPYLSPSPGELPLIGYGPTYQDVIPSVSDFEQLKECGFNVALYPGPHSQDTWARIMKDTMQNAEKAGMKVMIFDQVLMSMSDTDRKITEEMVKAYRDNKYLAGWEVMDEPKIEWIITSGASTQYQSVLKTACDRINALDPNHMAYANLVAATGEKWTGELNYSEYLNYIQENIKPPVWSFDFYSIIGHFPPKSTTVNIYVRPEWYEYLSYFKKIAEKSNRPFWSYCLCAEHYPVDSPEWFYPVVDTSYLRFYAFSALAYGAQGLVFWSYCEPPGGDYRFMETPVNKSGKKTSVWYNVKSVLDEIKSIQEIFINNRVISVKHVDNSTQGQVTPALKVTTTNAGVIVSFLGSEPKPEPPALPVPTGYDWVFIVNKNPFAKQLISITFMSEMTEIVNGKPINGYNNNMLTNKDLQKDMNVGVTKEYVLEAGGYILFKKV